MLRRFTALPGYRALRTASLVLLACLAMVSPASAELALLTDGSWIKISAYALTDDGRMRLDLPSGGRLVLPVGRIERILEDEVTRRPPPPAPPAFPLRFAEEHTVPEVPYGDAIFDAARRHRLNPQLVAAVVRAESAFRPDARSVKGAQGLMQLMPATAERFGLDPSTVLDPARNLDAGSRYLSWLIDRFDGRLSLVLAGYNAGEGAVDRFAGVPPYRETRGYIARIYSFLGLPEDEAGDAR